MARSLLASNAPIAIGTLGPVVLTGALGAKMGAVSLQVAYPPVNGCRLTVSVQRLELPLAISSIRAGTATSVSTAPLPHRMRDDDVAVIAGVSPALNGAHAIKIIDPFTFSITALIGADIGAGGQVQPPWRSIYDHTFVGIWPLPVHPQRGVGTATYGVSFGGEYFGANVNGAQAQIIVSEMTGGQWTASVSVDH